MTFIYYSPRSPLLFTILWYILLVAGFITVLFGLTYRTLHRVSKNVLHFTVEDFDPVHCILKIKNEREYTILYQSQVVSLMHWFTQESPFLYRWDIPPQHYQVWTQVKGIHTERKRYEYLKYVKPPGVKVFFQSSTKQENIVFEEKLMEICSQFHEEAKKMSSLRFVGLAQEKRESILFAMLTQYMDAVQINDVVSLLQKIACEIEYNNKIIR